MYLIIYMQGLSLLFAWSSLMNSGNFFIDRLAGMKDNYFMLDYLLVVFFGVRLVFVLASRYIMGWIRPFRLVVISQLATTIIFLIFGSLALWHALPNTVFLVLAVILVFLSAAFAVASFVSVYFILSGLDPKFTQAIALGHASAGLVTALLKMIAILVSAAAVDAGQEAFAETGHTDSVIYFYLASLIAFVALLLFLPMKRVDARKKHGLGLSPTSTADSDADSLKMSPKHDVAGLDALSASASAAAAAATSDPVPAPSLCFKAKAFMREHYRVYKEIKVFFWCIFIVLYQMVLIVPAFIYLTQSTHASKEINFYHYKIYPIFNLIVFSLGDFMGRFILRWPQFTLKTPKYLILISMLRFLFIPLYLFGNIVLQRGTCSLSSALSSDVFFSMSIWVFGFSGGFMMTNLLMYGPKAVQDEKDRNMASFCIIFCQGVALVLAASSALLLKVLLYATAT